MRVGIVVAMVAGRADTARTHIYEAYYAHETPYPMYIYRTQTIAEMMNLHGTC